MKHRALLLSLAFGACLCALLFAFVSLSSNTTPIPTMDPSPKAALPTTNADVPAIPEIPAAPSAPQPERDAVAVATFAGSCFWCMEPSYQEHAGVIDAVVGYAGGTAETATYSQVGRGLTEHREAVQVTYDPTKVSYAELVEMFWRQIDPTDDGGQFADRGHHYTTAIYYRNDAQKAAAEASKKALDDSGKFTKPVATLILPFTTFFPAEEYHQDFYKKSADYYQSYKEGSGRARFLEDNWAKTAGLELSDAAQAKSPYALSDEERTRRRQALDETSYHIIAEEGTEPPFQNAYHDNKAAGIYVDKISGEPLFSSVHKFDSGTGWPSFWQPIDEAYLTEETDLTLGVPRTEVRSRYGDSHLGHVFDDGPQDKTGLRYCMNSASLRFIPKERMAAEGYAKYLSLFEE